MAANIFRGDAPNLAQEVEFVLSGTWVAAETITVTIGNIALVLTIGATVDIPTVLDNLVVMITDVGTFDTDYSAANGILGNTSGAFSELTTTEDGTATLKFVALTAGKPFVISQSETSTIGAIAQTTTVTNNGKNDFETASNWSLGTVPVAADDVILEDSAVDLLFNLDQSAVAHNSIKVRSTYTGRFGLQEINRDGTLFYDEYRDTFFKTASLDIESAGPSDRIKIDSGATNNVVVNVIGAGTPETGALGAFLWKGTGTGNTVTAEAGSVGLGTIAFDNADIATLNVVNAAVVHLNGSATATNMLGTGTLNSDATITDLIQKADAVTTLTGTLAGAGSSITVEAGTVIDHTTGTVIDLTVMKDAKYDLAESEQTSRTVTNKATFHIDSEVNDPLGILVLTGGYTIPGGKRGDITADFGKNRSQYDVA